MAEYDSRRSSGGDKREERNDFLQWCIQHAKATGNPEAWKASLLAEKVLLLNFSAIHTSSFAIASAILELAASKQECIDDLRTEIEQALAEYGGQWDKRALTKMHKLDSTLRESARLNSIAAIGLNRAAIAKDGIAAPSGVKIPRGAAVGVPGYPILMDDSIYPDAKAFKPFRFSEKRSDKSVEYVKRAAKAFATTSTQYLAFGHGRHACAGRCFAAHELKLTLAHILLNYDIQIRGDRPRNSWYGLNRVPPVEATIRLKKRRFEAWLRS